MEQAKKKTRDELTPEYVRSRLDYDPLTGVFTWLPYPEGGDWFRDNLEGRRAGTCRATGYRQISLDGIAIAEHRLAWFYHYGVWPKDELDHIDRDRAHNAIANLREATRSQNLANRAANSRSKSGVKGVRQDQRTGKWIAYIYVDGKSSVIGRYENENDARDAYMAIAETLHGDFASDGYSDTERFERVLRQSASPVDIACCDKHVARGRFDLEIAFLAQQCERDRCLEILSSTLVTKDEDRIEAIRSGFSDRRWAQLNLCPA